MKEITINKNDSGQRFDKYLKKLLVLADSSFIYKMLRKKNIVLNGKKADGREILKENDHVKLFLSDETYAKFTKSEIDIDSEYRFYQNLKLPKLNILYEDDDILAFDKPKNLLSQKAKDSDISANEQLIAYMIQNQKLTKEEFRTFKPSVCNRLDQNTTGVLLFGKSKSGLQLLSKELKERTAKKYYYAIVDGKLEKEALLKGFLLHDETNNKVTISLTAVDHATPIETFYRPLRYSAKNQLTLLEIELITGKTHQIRAHLASIDHAIIGDYKYGKRSRNDYFKKNYQIDSQLLHSGKTIVNQLEINSDLPKIFEEVL